MEAEASAGFAGVPDAFQRLWTPHRMAYIGGENKPSDSSQDACPFCQMTSRGDADALVVHRGRLVFAVLNLYPYNPGHLLVCPYRHVADYTGLSSAERHEFGEVTSTAIEVLSSVSHPAGFNLGINQGAVAGAGIAAHLHQHIVPRWVGDSNFLPVVARTRALPELLSQTRDLVATAWAKRASGERGSEALG